MRYIEVGLVNAVDVSFNLAKPPSFVVECIRKWTLSTSQVNRVYNTSHWQNCILAWRSSVYESYFQSTAKNMVFANSFRIVLIMNSYLKLNVAILYSGILPRDSSSTMCVCMCVCVCVCVWGGGVIYEHMNSLRAFHCLPTLATKLPDFPFN